MRFPTSVLPVAAALLLLAGCGGAPAATTPTASPPPTASASPLPTLATLAPQSPSATPSPTPSRTPTPTPTPTPTAEPTNPADYFPSVDRAFDVSSFEQADFASPSGGIWCVLRADFAACNFPSDMNLTQVPTPAEVCPEEEGLDVTGVSVGLDGAAQYICGGDPVAIPSFADGSIDWWLEAGYPSVSYEGFELVTVPYGRSLVAGDLVCASSEAGISCGNTATGEGFTLARRGVSFLKVGG